MPVLRERLERTRGEELATAWTSSSRSRWPDGGVLGLSDYWWGWGDLRLPLAARDRGIAWIGSSFYFIALDNHLSRRGPPTRSAASAARPGRSTAAASTASRSSASRRSALPEPLYWFKWEAYTTWLSGFALIVVVYFVAGRPRTWSTGPSPTSTTWEAIAIAVALLVVAWLVYDGLCRVFDEREGRAGGRSSSLRLRRRVGRVSLFASRAAYLEVGAMVGTMMVGKIFFVIIPAHWKLVPRSRQAGSRTPVGANGEDSGPSTTTT